MKDAGPAAFATRSPPVRTGSKKAAGRSSETVCNAIGHILNHVTPVECSNYFANSGYDQK